MWNAIGNGIGNRDRDGNRIGNAIWIWIGIWICQYDVCMWMIPVPQFSSTALDILFRRELSSPYQL